MTGTISTATVETLTAQVRVLMVGSRQITMSVFKQLDVLGADHPRIYPGLEHFEPIGRVGYENPLWLIGAEHGQLARAHLSYPHCHPDSGSMVFSDEWPYEDALRIYNLRYQLYKRYEQLPLIVLAGLR